MVFSTFWLVYQNAGKGIVPRQCSALCADVEEGCIALIYLTWKMIMQHL